MRRIGRIRRRRFRGGGLGFPMGDVCELVRLWDWGVERGIVWYECCSGMRRDG